MYKINVHVVLEIWFNQVTNQKLPTDILLFNYLAKFAL